MSHQERGNGDFLDENSEIRDIFREFHLTPDHEGSILGTSDDTLPTQTREMSAMAKAARKPKRVGYAAASNIRKILAANRAGKLPTKLTREKLPELGVSDSDFFHVKNALEDLTFIDERGFFTPLFVSMARVSEAEYRDMLQKVIHHVYSDALKELPNLVRATSQQYYDAFSVYAYPKQHRKMIALFKELCQEAGLMVDETVVPRTQIDEVSSIPPQETPVPDLFQFAEGELSMEEPPSTTQLNGSNSLPDDIRAEQLGMFLTGLLQLPHSPGWMEENRTWWRQAVSFYTDQITQALNGQGRTKS